MYKNKMREIRESQGLRLKEVAQRTGITAGYLCHLEKGTRTNPSLQIMEKIAKALNRGINEIFFN